MGALSTLAELQYLTPALGPAVAGDKNPHAHVVTPDDSGLAGMANMAGAQPQQVLVMGLYQRVAMVPHMQQQVALQGQPMYGHPNPNNGGHAGGNRQHSLDADFTFRPINGDQSKGEPLAAGLEHVEEENFEGLEDLTDLF
jgi:hypothetical protein